jgi:hypothetical protein
MAAVLGGGLGGLTVRTLADGSTTLTMPGRAEAFYRTRNQVRDARLFAPSPGRTQTVVALWNERDARGVERPARAISLDGGAVVPVAGRTRYDIPLRFAAGGFTPAWTGVTRPGAGEAAAPGAVGEGEPAIPSGLRAGEANRLWIVQFVTQPLQEYREAITAAGGEIHRWLAHHCYVVEMDAGAVDRVAALPFVRWVGALHPAYRVDPGLITAGMAAGTPSHDPATARRYNILVNRRGLADKAAVAAAVEMLGGRVDFGLHGGGRVLGATLTEAQLISTAGLNAVFQVDAWHPADTDNEIARQLSGADSVEIQGGFRGSGVRGEILDQSLWQSHQAFSATAPWIHRTSIETFPPPGVTVAHGTSTYGIVFGRHNEGQAGGFKGFLPDAQGIFATYYRLEQNGGPIGREDHTKELVEEAGEYRAVFQSNSWGSSHSLDYTSYSAALDDALLLHNLTVFQSQGNLGATNAPRASRPEAWCKNTISVGGVKHRNTLTRADDEWNAFDWCQCGEEGRCFPYCPTDCQPICPSCETPCYYLVCSLFIGGASTGPAADGRIKPDLVHFYDAVRTPGSSCFQSVGNDTYNVNFGGTSAATPLTAGAAGLLFEMWHEGVFPGFGGGMDVFDSRPAASTVKALLINTAHQYDMPSATDLDRFRQGWGMVDVGALYDIRNHVHIVDESISLLPLQSYTLYVSSEGIMPFKVTLVWRDPPGAASSSVHRVNDLDLVVTSPSGHKYYGNDGLLTSHWSTPDGGNADSTNTVENVFVESPEAGTWAIVIAAVDINTDADLTTQDVDSRFAVVISGVSNGSPVIAPDWNRDGAVDGADAAAFLASYVAGRADVDRDGITTPVDAACFILALLDGMTRGN